MIKRYRVVGHESSYAETFVDADSEVGAIAKAAHGDGISWYSFFTEYFEIDYAEEVPQEEVKQE